MEKLKIVKLTLTLKQHFFFKANWSQTTCYVFQNTVLKFQRYSRKVSVFRVTYLWKFKIKLKMENSKITKFFTASTLNPAAEKLPSD